MENSDSLFEVKLSMRGKYKDLIEFYAQVATIFAVVIFLRENTKQSGIEELFVSVLLGKTFYELVVKRIVSFI